MGVEGHDDGAVEPGGGEHAQPVAVARKLEQRVLRPQEKPRVRREGQSRRGAAEFLGALQRGADHGAVATMDAVEIADRHHGAVQRTDIDGFGALCAFADDVEGSGFAHFRAMAPFRAGYG